MKTQNQTDKATARPSKSSEHDVVLSRSRYNELIQIESAHAALVAVAEAAQRQIRTMRDAEETLRAIRSGDYSDCAKRIVVDISITNHALATLAAVRNQK